MATRAELLERVRRAPGGQSAATLGRLLERYGFERHEGRRHTIFRHERMPPGAVVTVPRHGNLRAYVARSAVAAIDLIVVSGEDPERDYGKNG